MPELRGEASRPSKVMLNCMLHFQGAYTYVGALRHLPDGRLSWVGKFSWIGRERGAFSYVLERARDAAPGDGAPLSGDARLARMAMASTAG